MDLNLKMQEITNNVIETQLEEILKEQIVDTLKRTVRDGFREYSDFGKGLKSAIEDQTKVCFENLKLTDYNQFIISVIQEELQTARIEAVEPIKESIQKIVGVLDTKEIKFSDLVDKFKEEVQEMSCDDDGEITIICEYNEKYKWHTISLDEESEESSWKCDYHFTIYEDGKMGCFRHKDTFDDKNHPITPMQLSRMRGFELWLFRLVNNGCKVIVDETDFETEWSKYEEY